MDDFELDDILENALQDFEQEEARASPLDDMATMQEFDTDDILSKALASMQLGGNVTDGDKSIEEAFQDMSDEEKKIFNGFAENMQEFLQGLERQDRQQNDGDENKSFQDTIRDTVNMLKQNTDGLNDVNSKNSDSPFNMADLTKLLGGMSGGDGDVGEGDEEGMYGMLEKIMESLMSPEILKQPMEELRREYPVWLEENRGKVDPNEYERVEKQYEYAEKICKVYETSSFPACLPQLIDLMKDMQTYGSPPDDIVKRMTKDGDKGGAKGLQDMCPMQ